MARGKTYEVAIWDTGSDFRHRLFVTVYYGWKTAGIDVVVELFRATAIEGNPFVRRWVSVETKRIASFYHCTKFRRVVRALARYF